MQKPHEFTLSNGLRVVYLHYPNAAGFSISAMGRAGSMYENPGEYGAAHFLEHVVLDATRKYPDEIRLSGLIDNVGGYSNGGTSRESVQYYATVLNKDAEAALDFISEVIIHPLIKEESVKKHKGIISEEINLYLSDPRSYAYDKLLDLLYPHSRLGGLITGTEEDITSLTQEKLSQFHKTYYNAQNFVLSLCGAIDPTTLFPLIEKYFNTMPQGDVQKFPHKQESESIDIHAENWRDIKQANMYLGYYSSPIEDISSRALDIMSNIFGSGQLSRLFYTIREQHHLAYSVGSSNESAPGYGLFEVYVGLSDANISKCLKLYNDEAEKMCTNLVTDEEYDRTMNAVLASFLFKSDSPTKTASIYSYNKLFAREAFTFADIVEEYKAVTKEDIRSAAQKVFAQKPKVSIVGRKVSREEIVENVEVGSKK